MGKSLVFINSYFLDSPSELGTLPLPKKSLKSFKEVLFNENNGFITRQSKSVIDRHHVAHLNGHRVDGVRPHTCI